MINAIQSTISHGQTTIPKEIQQALHLQDGEAITWYVMPDRSIVVRAKNRPITDLDGLLPKPEKPVDIVDMSV